MKKEFIDIPHAPPRRKEAHHTYAHTREETTFRHSTFHIRNKRRRTTTRGRWNGMEWNRKRKQRKKEDDTPNQKLLLLLLFRVIRDSY